MQALIETVILWTHSSVFSVLIRTLTCHLLYALVRHLDSVLCRTWVLFSKPVSDAYKNIIGMRYSLSFKMQVVFYLMFGIVLVCTNNK